MPPATDLPLRAPGEMRRRDREITDPAQIADILHAGRVMRIALVDDGLPFLLPVFYGYDGQALYFHSAQQGSKVEILKRNNNVCFEVSLDQGVVEDRRICDFEAAHRTVIGRGKAQFVTGEAEKIRALDLIVARFTDRKYDYPPTKVALTAIVRIEPATIKGKRYGVGMG